MLVMHRHTARQLLLAAACMLALPVWAAEPQQAAAQSLQMLEKIQKAARTLDYSGVYTYQQGTVMLSSSIVHLVDGTGERERLELLDGAPPEFLLNTEVTQCMIPRSAMRRLGKRGAKT